MKSVKPYMTVAMALSILLACVSAGSAALTEFPVKTVKLQYTIPGSPIEDLFNGAPDITGSAGRKLFVELTAPTSIISADDLVNIAARVGGTSGALDGIQVEWVVDPNGSNLKENCQGLMQLAATEFAGICQGARTSRFTPTGPGVHTVDLVARITDMQGNVKQVCGSAANAPCQVTKHAEFHVSEAPVNSFSLDQNCEQGIRSEGGSIQCTAAVIDLKFSAGVIRAVEYPPSSLF